MAQPLSGSKGPDSVDPALGILERSSVALGVVVTADGSVLASNAGFQLVFGGDGDSPRSFQELLVESGDWEQCRLATAAAQPVVLRLRSPTGVAYTCKGDIWSQGAADDRRLVLVLVRTESEQGLRAAVQHRARMEALGSLTAGIAHDFNNLLTVLVGNLYLLAEELRDRPKLFDKLKAAREAAKRGSDLIKQLLAFARREHVQTTNIDPIRIIDDLTPLLRRALGARIALDTKFAHDAGFVRASAAQLESVVVNLTVNARDAIDGKGRIVIAVRRVEVSVAEAAALNLERSGAYVAIGVTDTGGGIPPEVLQRVFEPFFSTKGEGGGTGLGLSMVRWFAEQSQGGVKIESQVGVGTTVMLLLPALDPAADVPSEGTMPLATLPSGEERVVLLALDEGLRATMKQTLEVLGYRVEVAASVEALLDSLRANDAQLILVDGIGLADADILIRARAERPELRILLTKEASRTPRSFPLLGVHTVAKPFTLAEFAGAVRRALDSSPH